jgi:hypothetical protein
MINYENSRSSLRIDNQNYIKILREPPPILDVRTLAKP